MFGNDGCWLGNGGGIGGSDWRPEGWEPDRRCLAGGGAGRDDGSGTGMFGIAKLDSDRFGADRFGIADVSGSDGSERTTGTGAVSSMSGRDIGIDGMAGPRIDGICPEGLATAGIRPDACGPGGWTEGAARRRPDGADTGGMCPEALGPGGIGICADGMAGIGGRAGGVADRLTDRDDPDELAAMGGAAERRWLGARCRAACLAGAAGRPADADGPAGDRFDSEAIAGTAIAGVGVDDADGAGPAEAIAIAGACPAEAMAGTAAA
jgi:hypothetical protein